MTAPAPLLRCPECGHTDDASAFIPPRSPSSRLLELAGVVLAVVLGAVLVWLLMGGQLP